MTINDLGYDIEIERYYYRTLCKRDPRTLVVFLTRMTFAMQFLWAYLISVTHLNAQLNN